MKMKNPHSFCLISISLLASVLPTFAAGILNGDTTIKKQATEPGNLTVEGTDLKLGVDSLLVNPYSSYSPPEKKGQLKIQNFPYTGVSPSYTNGYTGPQMKSKVNFLTDTNVGADWTWGRYVHPAESYYNTGTTDYGYQMSLDAENKLSLYRKAAYASVYNATSSGSGYIQNTATIILDPGTGLSPYYTSNMQAIENAKILVAGNEVVTAANAARLLTTTLANNYVSLSPTQSFVVTGTTGGTANPPASGAGTRMMWYTEKAAFRAGNVTGNLWDKASIGIASAAFGLSTKASGQGSFASGYLTIASGICSTAMGNSTAAGDYSTSLGNSWATGKFSTSMGQTTASNYASVTIGQNNEMRTGGTSATAWAANNQNSVLEVGIGLNATSRKNALTVLQDGSVEIGKATATDNSVPLIIKADGTVILSKAQGDISMGIYQ